MTIATWKGGRFLVDRRVLAATLGVSVRTVRRYCRPAVNELGQVETDFTTGIKLYDALAALETLAGVVGRPDRTAAAIRARVAAAAAQAKGAA